MAGDEAGSLIPGWYGKIPCLGDFASRRLPPDFIQTWDAWLQRSLAESREALGDAWLDAFLTSPMWRFALTPGVCGENAWAGLMMPSVDKVGRYFPMTFALELPAAKFDIVDVTSAEAWYAKLEDVALSSLSADFDPEALESALAAVRFAAIEGGSLISGDVERALGCVSQPDSAAIELSDGAQLGTVLKGAAHVLINARTAGKTLWWSVERESGTTELHCMSGLPPETYFSSFLKRADNVDRSSIDVQVLEI